MSLFEILLLIQVFVLGLYLAGIGSSLKVTNQTIRELRTLLVESMPTNLSLERLDFAKRNDIWNLSNRLRDTDSNRLKDINDNLRAILDEVGGVNNDVEDIKKHLWYLDDTRPS